MTRLKLKGPRSSSSHKRLSVRIMAPKSSRSGGDQPKASAACDARPKAAAKPKASAAGDARPKAAAKPKAKATPSSRPPPKGSGKGKAKGPRKRLYKNPRKHWCLRISNPTPLDLQHLWCWSPPGGPVPATACKLEYIIIGWEGVIPPQPRTPHLQMYLEVEPPIHWQRLKDWFHNAHIEPRFGPAKAASDYCKKEGQWRERGEAFASRQTTVDKTIEWWTDFRCHIECCDTWKEVLLMDKYASMVTGKMNWVRTVWHNRTPGPTTPESRTRPQDPRTPVFFFFPGRPRTHNPRIQDQAPGPQDPTPGPQAQN